MSLFRNRQVIPPPKQTIQKDYDQGIDKDMLQKQILTTDATISQINKGFKLYDRIVKINGGEETTAMIIMRKRLLQKVNDFEQFLYDLEDPLLTVNYVDAYLAVQDKVQQRMLFDSLLTKSFELPPTGSTAPKTTVPTLYETLSKIKFDTGFERPVEVAPSLTPQNQFPATTI